MEIGLIQKPSIWLFNQNKKDRTDELFMGWAVGILKEEGEWRKVVSHYGYQGYVKREALRLCTQKELRQREESGQTIRIQKPFADVMEQPDLKSRVLTTLPKGSFLTALPKKQNGFQKIEMTNGVTGYIVDVAWGDRTESDGYLYNGMPEGYFLRQKSQTARKELDVRESLAAHARQYLGVPYRWAGKSAEGIDCSGLTFMCYFMNGILLYRDAKIKEEYPVREIPKEKMKLGDLLYFPGHIAMYLGNGKYIHATGKEDSRGCVVNSLLKQDADYRKDLAESFLAAGSIWK